MLGTAFATGNLEAGKWQLGTALLETTLLGITGVAGIKLLLITPATVPEMRRAATFGETNGTKLLLISVVLTTAPASGNLGAGGSELAAALLETAVLVKASCSERTELAGLPASNNIEAAG